MSYRRAQKVPDRNTMLAKGDAGKNASHYMSRARSEAAHWTSLGGRRIPLIQNVEHSLADIFLTELANTPLPVVTGRGPLSPEVARGVETISRTFLGIVALSVLCRDIIPDELAAYRSPLSELEAEDETVVRWGSVIPELPQLTEDGKSLDSRLHLPSDMADELLGPRPTKGWYVRAEGDLYVRRPGPPANPSSPFMEGMMSQNIAAPFDNLETVYPYLPAVKP